MKTLKFTAAAAALLFTLGACGSDAGTSSTTDATDAVATSGDVRATDVSHIEKVDDIAALLPESVTKDGKLTIGTNAFYAPAEFYAEDGTTMQGFDVDLANALGKVLGLEVTMENAEFAAVIPGIGKTYEAGIAAISVNPERQEAVDLTQYYEAGLQWAVPSGNPKKFDPADVCGKVVGVQTGTAQDEYLTELNTTNCKDKPVQIQRQSEQPRISLELAQGQLDAMFADTPVIDFAILQTNKQIEKIGKPIDVVGLAIATPKGDPTTEAIDKALQHLIDTGELAKIFETWGIKDGVATSVALNPAK
ncbi:ABC transporter substrate-binding protein [Arcanobacterium phocae]|uniref:Amino acid ABC transporter substrate-binding protein, PAAT family n=1 Tax=Arcanobacterium phocae TaxID=131112 RepID=A0A1H2LAU5_9ACTO|nr:ABC transporter substrate-binding protein [Arcanobacterium phocae]SDU78113.1 amino acid ABC transporter substrate-binding protein, PAAT family [Arcanobacterium phocae]